MRHSRVVVRGLRVLVAAAIMTAPALSLAQPATPDRPRVAVSISPTTVVPSWYQAAEVEVRVRNVWTVGAAAGTVMGMPAGPGVTASTPEERLVHLDAFGRVFFAGRAFDGWSLGARAGLTQLPGERTHPGFGLDVLRHWTIGRHLVGNVGWGMKRVFGGPGTAFDQRYIPWVKAHVGLAF
jgi:hypothetical protein